MADELREYTLERNGYALHYWLGGAPQPLPGPRIQGERGVEHPAPGLGLNETPLVVFTHGATVDHHEWDASLPLVGEHFRVLTWDMPGHGLSRPAAFSMPGALGDLLALLDTLRVEQAILVGHSLGGNLHQEVVFHHPDRVKAMACLDCTWNFQKLTRLEAFMLRLAGPIFKLYPYQLLIDQSLAMTANTKASQELLRPAAESHTKEEFTQILMAGSVCLHYEPGYTTNKPLLLMVGEKDATGNIRKAMPAWARAEPDCALVVFPNARHAPNLDAPEAFHRCLMGFLQKVSSPLSSP